MSGSHAIAKTHALEIELPLEVAMTDDSERWKPYIAAALAEARRDHPCMIVRLDLPIEIMPPNGDFEAMATDAAIAAIRSEVAAMKSAAAVKSETDDAAK